MNFKNRLNPSKFPAYTDKDRHVLFKVFLIGGGEVIELMGAVGDKGKETVFEDYVSL